MTGMEAVAGFTFNWLSSCQPFKSGIITSSRDRKSTRLNSSHLVISYAVFCLKKHTILPSTSISLEMMRLQLELTAPTNFGMGVDFYFMTLQTNQRRQVTVRTLTVGIVSNCFE